MMMYGFKRFCLDVIQGRQVLMQFSFTICWDFYLVLYIAYLGSFLYLGCSSWECSTFV